LQRAFVALGLVSLALLNGCDQSTYGGMDGSHALAKANTLPLPDAYSFYLASYKGVHPPMLDVAPTFSRFGSKGTAYLSSKALETQDRQEFEADLHALLILDYHCDQTLTDALANKSKRMSANTPAGHAHNLGLVPGMGRSYGKFGWE
jgi:hypothetical protein